MSNYLNPSSAFVILLVGFGLFTGGTVFMGSAFEKHNVEQTQNLTVDKQYDNLQDQTRQLDQRISTVTSDQGSIVDTASAGILIVPDTLSLLTQPIGIATSTLNSVRSMPASESSRASVWWKNASCGSCSSSTRSTMFSGILRFGLPLFSPIWVQGGPMFI